MKEKIEKYLDFTYNNKIVHILLIIFVTIALSMHMKDFQIYDTHDGPFHLLRILVTSRQIDEAIIPPIISPYSWNGLGVGMNLFYPPISTYVPIFFMNMLDITAGSALKTFCVLSIFLSGLFMYFCMEEFTENKRIAVISAIIYMILPYKLNNIYVRVAVGEIAASVFIPLVFMGLHSLLENDGKRDYLITIGAAGIILSHTISTMYVAIFATIYLLLHIKKVIKWNVVKSLIINAVFIILISGIFVFPYFETSSSAKYRINTDELMGTYNEFLADKTLNLRDLLHNVQVENHMVLYLGMPAIIGILLTVIAIPILIWKKQMTRDYILFLICTILCIWMSTKYFPWLKIPKIFAKLQFPWRMMGFGNFFMCFVIGINYFIVLRTMPRLFFVRDFLIVFFISVAVINSTEISKNLETWGVFKDKEIEKAWMEEGWFPRTNCDFAPEKADVSMLEKTGIPMNIYSNNKNLEIIRQRKSKKLTYSATVRNLKKGDIISIPYLYYPYYELKVSEDGGKTFKIKPTENEYGMIQFTINKDISKEAHLEIYYKPSIIVLISYCISPIAIIVFCGWVVRKKMNATKLSE